MTTTARLWLRAFLVLALLWQAGSAPAAALMACCDTPQPCCIAALAAPACAVTAACALAAVPMALPMAKSLPALRQTTPDYRAQVDCSAWVDPIWRPPIMAA